MIMKKIAYLLLSLSILAVISCNSSSEKANGKDIKENRTKIEHLEDSLYSDTISKIDKKKALELTNLYREFAKNYPEDKMAASYLYRAAEVITTIGNPMEAIKIYNKLIADYPDFEKIANCYFMKGFVYDNNLLMYKEAKEAYEEFIKKFPTHDLADDAEMSIKYLGKSNEEIIKEFEKNRK